MKMLRGLKLGLTALLLVPLVSACGGGGQTTSNGGAADTLSGEAAGPATAVFPGNSPAAGEQSPAGPSAQPGNGRRIVEISFPFARQEGIATNQFAVWVEDGNGRFIRTLYATRFIASGGYKQRPEAIPTWVERSGLAQASPEQVDAVSGATVAGGQLTFAWDCKDQEGRSVPDGNYRFCVEGTTRWENRILYEGTIAVGKERAEAEAAVKYTTEEATQSGMIGQVTAEYTP